MCALEKQLDWVPERLNELLGRYGIPAGSIAVWHDGDEYLTAAGMANHRAKIEATTDTLFLIGSNTKVYTTTLIMQLIENGLVQLDSPVRNYVPELQLNDEAAAESLTVRHLLTHTNGITGDYFPDFGRGDDAVEKLVASLAEVEMLYAPGEFFSYSNSGFILAGRLIERVTGSTWDAVLRSELLEPIGSREFATLPEEALLHRTAVGHSPDPETGEPVPGQMWPQVRSGGPAGFTPFATARDLVRFARLHLSGGFARDGERILSQANVEAMQAKHVERTPSGPFDNDGWGLGWARYQYRGDDTTERVIGHNGGSSAMLRVLPDQNFAVASLTNASGGIYAGHHLIDGIVDELFGVRIPASAEATSAPENLDVFAGRYHHYQRTQIVERDVDKLMTWLEGDTSPPVTLEPLDGSTFLARTAGLDIPARASFLQPDEVGRPQFFHIGARANKRDE